ncbi:kinase-like domain-containing protein [Pisolithus marmoratus]|nr:kinase-like domain-containing protein [Pisolithus marmoratus]
MLEGFPINRLVHARRLWLFILRDGTALAEIQRVLEEGEEEAEEEREESKAGEAICWQEDSGKIHDQKSSAVKVGNFVAYFIQPPFFCDGGSDIKYEIEMPWGFLIFIGTHGALDVWCKYRLKSDLIVSSQGHLIPFFVSEVISMKSEDDRFQMLLQAIAAMWVGKILLKKMAEHKFFVVAVYLNKNMVASQYIVMQTGQDNDEPTEEFHQGNAVSIHCNDFNLTDSTEATEFAREMYNLVGELNDLANNLDRNMVQTLKQIVDAAKDLDSIPEQGADEEPHEDMEGGEEDELGIFSADNVQEHLSSMNSMVDFHIFGHENLTVVRCKTDDSIGYVKFVKTSWQREVTVLQFLGSIQSQMNHTISRVGFWPVQGRTMISMPVAGGQLTSLERPNEHLWSTASQLVEGVTFMHMQLVAHMDLKPENIIIPPQGGHLSIINFSSSILLKSEKWKFCGIASTTGYITPEVKWGNAYKPIQADLWSCG